MPVIAVASHDTASAASVVPGEGDFAFISSGTWSVTAVLIDEPVTSDDAFAAGYADEITLGGYFFAMNILGLWLVQELKRKWAKAGEDMSYTQITEAAGGAKPFTACINPNDPRFLAPADMEKEINDYCKETGQTVPGSKGEFVRTVLESLALCYRHSFDQISRILGKKIDSVNIVGGGIQNKLLCQFTADACKLPVTAGPVEATALGNVLIQALATGALKDAAAIRAIVRNSYDLAGYSPQNADAWERQYQKYLEMTEERS